TKAGHAMQAIYFRPCRFRAAEKSDRQYVMESLQYALNDLSRSQKQSRAGVAIIINLAGDKDNNFHGPTVSKFLGSTEGKLVPTKVNLLIFVDAPAIFKPMMNFAKRAFSMNFAKKVHSIKSSKLSSFFMPGKSNTAILEMSDHDDSLGISMIGNRARVSEAEPQHHDGDDDPELHEKAHSVTKIYMDTMKEDSQVFSDKLSSSLPEFEAKEVTLGTRLGHGEFGIVYSIASFHIEEEEEEGNPASPPQNLASSRNSATEKVTSSPPRSSLLVPQKSSMVDSGSGGIRKSSANKNISRKDSTVSFAENPVSVMFEVNDQTDDSSLSDEDEEIGHGNDTTTASKVSVSNVSKSYMSSHVSRNGRPRYAVKRLRKDLKGENMLYAASDLASEAGFLKALRHSNICRCRGTIGEPGKQDFAIILDRLTMTLRDKMMEWKKEDEGGSLFSKLERLLHQSPNKKEAELQTQKERYSEKLLALYDTARALRYLAKHSIVFRDLKPENLAYDVRGDVRLFDFGLARELKEKDKIIDNKYNLTGLTGSRRYMAPEVILCKAYGLPVDVYSFAVMFWEVMSNHNAYSFLNFEKHFEMVVTRKKRPNLKKMIPKKQVLPDGCNIHNLVEQSWSPDPSKRPTFETLCDLLGAEVMKASSKEGSSAVMDRSTFLVNESLRSRADLQ
ncbi:MAG: hypothetical protein SGBAC_013229, partial [Bacillariaceae sp.]